MRGKTNDEKDVAFHVFHFHIARPIAHDPLR